MGAIILLNRDIKVNIEPRSFKFLFFTVNLQLHALHIRQIFFIEIENDRKRCIWVDRHISYFRLKRFT